MIQTVANMSSGIRHPDFEKEKQHQPTKSAMDAGCIVKCPAKPITLKENYRESI